MQGLSEAMRRGAALQSAINPVTESRMARILYAALGDGLGHAVRAHSVGAGLMERGHSMHFVSSLKGSRYLHEHFPDSVTDIFGFSLAYDNGRVRRTQTLLGTVYGAGRNIRATLQRLARVFRTYRPDLVVVDGEWFVPKVAKRMGVPFVSLDNQHLLTHCRVERPPGMIRDFWGAYTLVRLYHTGARRYFVSTFFDAPIRHQPTTLVPPILRHQVYAKRRSDGDHWLVYLGGSGGHDRMCRTLEAFDAVPMRAYGFGRTGQVRHVTYKPPCTDEFIEDLAGCAAVVASAGHTLIGECLYFEKPMLLVPFARQFEQRLNAHMVTQMGVGRFVDDLSVDALGGFDTHIEDCRRAMRGVQKPALEPVLQALERELP